MTGETRCGLRWFLDTDGVWTVWDSHGRFMRRGSGFYSLEMYLKEQGRIFPAVLTTKSENFRLVGSAL